MFLRLLSIGVKALIWLLQKMGRSGTALPGLWIELYCPSLIRRYASRYKYVIFITGTNGKTTTQLTLKKVLETAGFAVTSNSSGSNMFRGIATTLVGAGVPKISTVCLPVLLCEVEEATIPRITQYISPHFIVITNFYRDQLDAYGELQKTAKYVQEACMNCPDATLVVNKDDPIAQGVVSNLPNKKIAFSLGTYAHQFAYEGMQSCHVECNSEITASNIIVQDDYSTLIKVQDSIRHKEFTMHFQPPGIYNVYNALSSYVVASELGISNEHVISGLASVQAPFGRGECVQFTHGGKNVLFQIFLVKNPVGFTQVWNLFSTQRNEFNLVLGLNDNIADGRDVSWIWDVPFEGGTGPQRIHKLYFMGTRALDMALRFKYSEISGIDEHTIQDISTCLDDIIQKSSDGQKYHILATYTAMNTFRLALGRYINILQYTT